MALLSSKTKAWKSSLDDIRLPFSLRSGPSSYRPRWESGSSMRRVSSVQSISAYSVTRVTSTDPYYSSTASLRQRSSSREGSAGSDFLPSCEELAVRKSSYSWRKNFDMDLRRGGNREDLASGENQGDMTRGGKRENLTRGENTEDLKMEENSKDLTRGEDMLTKSVTVGTKCLAEMNQNDSKDIECKPIVKEVGKKTSEDNDDQVFHLTTGIGGHAL